MHATADANTAAQCLVINMVSAGFMNSYKISNIEQGISNVEVNSQNQNNRKFDLEERLIDFAVLLIEVSDSEKE